MPKQNYPRQGSQVLLTKERAFRTPEDTKDVSPTIQYAIDLPEEGAFPIMRNKLKVEKKYTVGGGRKYNYHDELGFDAVDQTVPFRFQTARWAFLAWGQCETTGVSHSPAITGNVVSGQGTAVLNLGITMVVDAHIGEYIEVTHVGTGTTVMKFLIIDNDASTVTLDINTPTNINGDAFEIFTGPYIKEITEIDSVCQMPTSCLRIREPNVCDEDQDIIVDLLGILVKSWQLTLEKGGAGTQEIGVNGAKSIDEGLSKYDPAIPEFALDNFRWGDIVDTFVLTYDGENIIEAGMADIFRILLENDVENEPTLGDFYPNYPKVGTLDYTITVNYYPKSLVFFNLINKPLSQYASPIAGVMRIEKNADRYFQLTMNSLRLGAHPEEIPSKEDKVMNVECELWMMPRDNPQGFDEGSVAIEAKDDLGLGYFEGSYSGPDPV